MWGYTPVVSALQSGRREDQKFKDILKDITHFTQPRLQEMLGGGGQGERGETEREVKEKERQKRGWATRGREGEKEGHMRF